MLLKFYVPTIEAVGTKVTNIILDDSNLSFLLPPLSLSFQLSHLFFLFILYFFFLSISLIHFCFSLLADCLSKLITHGIQL